MTRRVHCRRSPLVPTINIGRPNYWGNPHVMQDKSPGERDRVCDAFNRDLLSSRKQFARVPELRNQVLGCWCLPGQRCHGDILCYLANLPPADFALL